MTPGGQDRRAPGERRDVARPVRVMTGMVVQSEKRRWQEEGTMQRQLHRWLVVLVAGLTAGACSGTEVERPSATASEAPGGTGVIEGRVRLIAERLPRPAFVRNTTDPGVCDPQYLVEDYAIDEASGGLARVIVGLADVPPERIPAVAPRHVVLDNNGCQFEPQASVLTAGSTLEALNSDPVLHTVHLYGAVEMNISLPVQGMRIERVLGTPGLIAVRCDIHGWMQSFIRVDEHPFHAVTDRSGVFRIAGVPPGNYTFEAWHPALGWNRRSVKVDADQVTEVEVDYRLDGQ